MQDGCRTTIAVQTSRLAVRAVHRSIGRERGVESLLVGCDFFGPGFTARRLLFQANSWEATLIDDRRGGVLMVARSREGALRMTGNDPDGDDDVNRVSLGFNSRRSPLMGPDERFPLDFGSLWNRPEAGATLGDPGQLDALPPDRTRSGLGTTANLTLGPDGHPTVESFGAGAIARIAGPGHVHESTVVALVPPAVLLVGLAQLLFYSERGRHPTRAEGDR